MTLKDTLRADMTAAMKERKTDASAEVRLMTLRSALGAITKAETGGGARKDLTDADVEAVLRKEAKTRRETAAIYLGVSEAERAARETAEAEILEAYVSQELSEDEVRALVTELIADNGLAGAGGRAIGQVMGLLKGRSDVNKGVASKVAKELLG